MDARRPYPAVRVPRPTSPTGRGSTPRPPRDRRLPLSPPHLRGLQPEPLPGLPRISPTSRSMTARSARCQARSSLSWSDCSRNSWPGTVRICGGARKDSGPRGRPRGACPRGCGAGEPGRTLTCRTWRRLDRWRPCDRAAPRRSTLLSGRLPAGAWPLGERLRPPRSCFPHCLPHPVGFEEVGGSLAAHSSTLLGSALPHLPGRRGGTQPPTPAALTQPEEGAVGGGGSR